MDTALLIVLFFLASSKCSNSSEYSESVGLGWNTSIDDRADVVETSLGVKSRTQNVDTWNTWYWLVFLRRPDDLHYWRLAILLWDDDGVDDNNNVQPIWSIDKKLGLHSSISLQHNGDLVLKNENQVPEWSISVPNVTKLQMNRDGYMELVTGQNKSVWSSFNSPTINSLVCGQVLRNGSRLVNGSYSFQFDSAGASLTYNFQYPYQKWNFTTSSSNSLVFAALCCDRSGAYLQIRSDVGSISESGYLISNWVDCGGSPVLAQILSLSVIADQYVAFASLDGGLLYISKVWKADYNSTPADSCTVPNSCGSYGLCKDGSCSGCVLGATYLEFLDPQHHAAGCKLKYDSGHCEMQKETGIHFYYNPNSMPSLSRTKEHICRKRCADSSTCRAAFYQRQRGSCFLVDKVGSLRYVNQSYVAFFKVCTPFSSKQVPLRFILGITLGSLAAVCVSVAILICIKRRAKQDESDAEDILLASCLAESTLRKFSFQELDEITSGFTEKLGKGGFGTVYKGHLADGKFVAVKILHESVQEAPDFYAEISILSRVRHLNLVQLLGFGIRKSKRALVYEYMANGTLDDWLMCRRSKVLGWEHRMEIAIGAAKGLGYLHEECPEKILHLDVKPQNILLDENFRPKVADFGISRLVDRSETGLMMTTIRGTPGYLSPELCEGDEIDIKSDVYSFGVVLLEILSGDKLSYKEKQEIWDYSGFVDKKLKGSFDVNEASRMLEVSILCTDRDPKLRPSMSTVVQMLEGKETIPHRSHFKKINIRSLAEASISTTTFSSSSSDGKSHESSIITLQDR